MRRSFLSIIAAVLLAAFSGWTPPAQAKSSDEAAIRALLDNFRAAFRAKDLAKLMASYEPGADFVAYDVIPPRQYAGTDAYKKDWEQTFDMFSGPITDDLVEQTIVADGNLAYSRSIEHVTGTFKAGGNMDMIVRVTDVYRKKNGKWLIIHEHVSVPVDLTTGKADMQSK